MHVITGTFATPNGSKYLQQLCKHFGHKIEVEFTETDGTCAFDMGKAIMHADASGLSVRFELDGPEHVDRAHHVIDKHLERFAFREDFTGMIWDG
jgi:hypothetical protein